MELSRLCALFVLLSVIGDLSAQLLTPEQQRNVDNLVEDVLKCSKVPGLTLSVVKEDQVFTKAYGLRDVEKAASATEDTLFCIGSLTKAMTVTLLSKLLPKKYPTSLWDTKVKDILGDSFQLFTAKLTDDVTIKDILTHRTGLVSGGIIAFAGFPPHVSREDLVKKLRFLPSSMQLMYRFDYNNWMYMLAGHIAEVLAGNKDSYEELLTRHVLEPLGMTSTVVVKDLGQLMKSRNIALPYFAENGKLIRMPNDMFSINPAEPAGSVCSTAKDMSSWIRFLLQAPLAPAVKDVTDPVAFRHTMKPYQLVPTLMDKALTRPTFPVVWSRPAYGLGWVHGMYRGYYQISHAGSIIAYTSLLWLYPDLKCGIFVAMNGIPEGNERVKLVLTSYVSDILLGETPWLNSTTACTFPRPWSTDKNKGSSGTPETPTTSPATQPHRPLADYTGIYGHRFIGDIHVGLNASDNTLRLKLGRLCALLFPASKMDEFDGQIIGNFHYLQTNESSFQNTIRFVRKRAQVQQLISSAVGQLFVFDKSVRFNDNDASGSSKIFYSFLIAVGVLATFSTNLCCSDFGILGKLIGLGLKCMSLHNDPASARVLFRRDIYLHHALAFVYLFIYLSVGLSAERITR